MLVVHHPSYVRLSDDYLSKRAEAERLLTYTDKSVEFELQKHKHSSWYINQHGEEAWQARLEELQAARKKCLLFEDDSGHLYTYAGLSSHLANHFRDTIIDDVLRPEPQPLPWKKKPNELRPYQHEMYERMLEDDEGGPIAVQVGTGLGKSRVILELCRQLGLKTIVMAPLAGIAEQLHRDFVAALGEKYVGYYGGGKHKFKKLITIAVAASLTRIEEGSEAWKELSTAKVFIADESHQTPAASLKNVCFGLCADAPYRFFFSGTQTRGDGAELLLKGIVGRIVYTMTVREGVDQHFLARPYFRMFQVQSDSPFEDRDANAMTRKHLFYNPRVFAAAANFANKAVELLGHQVLILIDEVEQFSKILPLLKHDVRLAHGGLIKENKARRIKGNMHKVPEAFHDSDPLALVEQFNNKEFPVLIGTSCIATGLDVRSVQTMIYLRGGKSEIEVKQSVGRTTRLFPGKVHCNIIDFDVTNVEKVHAHAEERAALYEDIYGPVQFIPLGR